MNLTGDRNQCPTCKKYFNSSIAFDKRRTGQHGVDRRCRTTEEMEARGMVLCKDGFWVTKIFDSEALSSRKKAPKTV